MGAAGLAFQVSCGKSARFLWQVNSYTRAKVWQVNSYTRSKFGENATRGEGGKLGARTCVCLCAFFVHKLTVVGVLISDVVECRQFRDQVSSKFNLKKLQYWLTWKRTHDAFGQGEFQHYRMVKRVMFSLLICKITLKVEGGMGCPAGILKEKGLYFWEKNARNQYSSYMLRQDPRIDGCSISFSGRGGYQSAGG